MTKSAVETVILHQFACDPCAYVPALSHKENGGEEDGNSILNPGSPASVSFQKLWPLTEAKLSGNSGFQMAVWRAEEPVIEILPIHNETLMWGASHWAEFVQCKDHPLFWNCVPIFG